MQNTTKIVKVLKTFNIWFLWKKIRWVFPEKHEFLKIAKDSKIVENCVWNITISQNVPFSPKNWWIFWRKMNNLKIAKDSKIVVECDWNITISQNVPFFPKNWWTFWKKMIILKIGKSSKVVTECDRNSESSQIVQNVIFLKKIRWTLPEKTWIFENRYG